MKQNSFIFAGFLKPRDGYGYGTIKIGEALKRLMGNAVEIVDLAQAGEDAAWEFELPVVAVCTPDWLPRISAPVVVAHTMFEATRLPLGVGGRRWVDILNTHADAVIVPCRWNAETFRANGVTTPISVARWGVDPRDYWPLDREDHATAPFTFLWSGTPDRRKGWDVAYRAFREAFGDQDDVRMVMHFRELPPGMGECSDANVEIVAGLVGRPELRAMLQKADCYVFPSRGEGWGLPPREAAATGLPVIATNYGGLAEEITHWAYPLRVAGTSQADYGFWDGDLGEWAEPDVEHCAELMQWCTTHPVAAQASGMAAADWLAANGTWDRTAAAIAEAVERVTSNG